MDLGNTFLFLAKKVQTKFEISIICRTIDENKGRTIETSTILIVIYIFLFIILEMTKINLLIGMMDAEAKIFNVFTEYRTYSNWPFSATTPLAQSKN